MTPVRTLGSNKVILLMLAISALIPATALPLWQEELVTTGTQYWLNSSSMVSDSTFVPWGVGGNWWQSVVIYTAFVGHTVLIGLSF